MAIIKVITPSVTDANITTAKVTDNAITLAKMASGTDGNIISYDASGNPVAIATGNDGQVLTSTGAGSPPAFENAAGETNNICFRASLGSTQNIGNGGGYATLALNVEQFDQGGCYNNTGSTVTLNGLSTPAYSFCPNRAGKYLFFAAGTAYQANSNFRYGHIRFSAPAYRAGGNGRSGLDFSANYGYAINPSVTDVYQLNGTGDSVKVTMRGYAGSNNVEVEAGVGYSFFGAVFLTSN